MHQTARERELRVFRAETDRRLYRILMEELREGCTARALHVASALAPTMDALEAPKRFALARRIAEARGR